MEEIIIATKNKGKAKEFSQLFQQYGITVKSLLDIPGTTPDVEETGTTFQENAQLKADEIAEYLGKTVIADDSGLIVDALDGRPGVYSARYAGEPTDDKRNNDKLLAELKHIEKNDRTARFTCVLAYSAPNKETIFAKGSCEGSIAVEPMGDNGFGYDPLFIPQGYSQTMAELSGTEKNRISHRSHALHTLEEILQQTGLLGDKNEA